MPTLNTEIRMIPMSQLRHLEKNARYMTNLQQDRLTDNLKRDGVLTSLPLVWIMHDDNGKQIEPLVYEIVSGNHRVTSAKSAGFEEIECIVLLDNVPEERRIEIQLAHNAISGQDDLAILSDLYEGLSLDSKMYSGLTDDIFSNLPELSVSGLGVAGIPYQELVLSFLPNDAVAFDLLLKKAAKREHVEYRLAHISEFNQIFETLVDVKETLNIQNSAVAFSMLATLAIERLDQIKAETAKSEAVTGDGGSDSVQVVDDAETPVRVKKGSDKSTHQSTKAKQ